MIEVTVKIKDCHSCRHLDHSGQFTPGGARWICSHPQATNMLHRKEGIPLCDRECLKIINSDAPKSIKDEAFKKTGSYWGNRILPKEGKELPDWCPLKHGTSY